MQAIRAQLDDALAQLKIRRAESEAMERAVLPAAAQGEERHAGLRQLRGKRIVYVGGRPGSNPTLKSLVESTGGQRVLHDGGIDHDSMSMLKRVCERHQVAYYPLRTASVASFVELTTRVSAAA